MEIHIRKGILLIVLSFARRPSHPASILKDLKTTFITTTTPPPSIHNCFVFFFQCTWFSLRNWKPVFVCYCFQTHSWSWDQILFLNCLSFAFPCFGNPSLKRHPVNSVKFCKNVQPSSGWVECLYHRSPSPGHHTSWKLLTNDNQKHQKWTLESSEFKLLWEVVFCNPSHTKCLFSWPQTSRFISQDHQKNGIETSMQQYTYFCTRYTTNFQSGLPKSTWNQ